MFYVCSNLWIFCDLLIFGLSCHFMVKRRLLYERFIVYCCVIEKRRAHVYNLYNINFNTNYVKKFIAFDQISNHLNV